MENFNPQFAKLGEILINNGKATESGINEAVVQQKTTNEKITRQKKAYHYKQ